MAKKLTKRESCRIHAKGRALERYGVRLVGADLDAMYAATKDESSNAELLAVQSRTKSTWRMTYKEIMFVFVVDVSRGTVVTFLPPDDTVLLTREDIIIGE